MSEERWTLTGDSPWTWVTHAVVALAVTYALALGPGAELRERALASVACFLAFVWREIRDKARKEAWTDKWKRDLVGDLLGPGTVMVSSLMAWLA